MNITNVENAAFENNSWKKATLSVAVLVMFAAFLVLANAVYNRKWQPFKSKQLKVLCVAFVGGLCYMIALLQMYQIVDQSGAFGICHLWFLWFQMVFGCCLTTSVLGYRMRRLYFLIKQTKAAKGFWFWFPLVAFYVPTPLLAILAEIFPSTYVTPSPTVMPDSKDGIPGCVVYPSVAWYLYALYFAVLLQVIHLWILTFMVARIRASFNEFKENVIINIISTVLLFLSLGLVVVGFNNTPSGKVILLFLGAVFSFSAAIGSLIAPTFGFFFYKDLYLAAWKKGMRDENLPSGLAYDSTTHATQKASLPSQI
ncbi:hypothetical protein HDV06_003334 [Boothiomyces sp. JEL0866]|nr:hypothetical protein HDV06_003334 [Boothiomyces sp. JEL0866]